MAYLDNWLKGEKLSKVVERGVEMLKDVDFDTIAVRGTSGLMVGGALAARMKKDLIIVRKDTESAHSDNIVEGAGANQKILIVDDFIESGATMDDILEKTFTHCIEPEYVGIFLYAETSRYRESYSVNQDEYKVWKIWRRAEL